MELDKIVFQTAAGYSMFNELGSKRDRGEGCEVGIFYDGGDQNMDGV